MSHDQNASGFSSFAHDPSASCRNLEGICDRDNNSKYAVASNPGLSTAND